MGWTVVNGASRGIGLGLVRASIERGDDVVATSRDPDASRELVALGATRVVMDMTDEASVRSAAQAIASITGGVRRVINAAGILHDATMKPERRIEDVSVENLSRSFRLNTFAPMLVAKHFLPFLDEPSVFATLSARIGSIADNRLGGWYAYRSSKAAQNMFTKTLSIEVTRRRRNIVVVALHPGTVDTALSQPFQRGVNPEKLFTVERAATQLLDVIDGLSAADNGRFLAYDGSPIEW